MYKRKVLVLTYNGYSAKCFVHGGHTLVGMGCGFQKIVFPWSQYVKSSTFMYDVVTCIDLESLGAFDPNVRMPAYCLV